MSLLNHQIEAVLREYDQIRAANTRTAGLRKEEVYSRVPEIKKLDEELSDNALNWLVSSFDGISGSISTLRDKNAELAAKREKLLIGAGYPADYLDPVYTCPTCHDTGYVGNEKCACFRSKLVKHLYTGSNLMSNMAKENFDTFDLNYYSDRVPSGKRVSPRENIKKCVDKAKAFISDFDSSFANLIITGNTGIGKTFLCNCIANELIKSGHSVVYETEYDLFDALKKNVFSKDDPSAGEKFQCFLDCDLLIIDDLGTGFNNSLLNSEFFRVLNERLLARRSTVISTNLHLEDIQNNYSERVLSRIIGSYDFIEIYGDDIRKLKKISGGQSNGQETGNT